MKHVPTITAQIYIAGDLDTARAALRRYTLDVGLCVTLEPVEFVYTGGLETGMRVGLINYPRFPTDTLELRARALDVARYLRTELCQHSFSIVMPDETIWDSLRNETSPAAKDPTHDAP